MKKTHKLYFIFLLFSSIWIQIYSQTTEIPQITPVSPNASSLGMFGSIPVGHYSGTPNISIPIYDLDLDGLKIPMSLSYNASGIKVAQEATSVGLGWTLIAGGSIVKEIRGWNDFGKNYSRMGSPSSSDVGYYFNKELPPSDANNNPIINPNVNPTDDPYEVYKGIDGQPDLFHFNFGNYSGTLFFEKNGKNGNTSKLAKPVLLHPKESPNITYNIETDSWTFIDPNGYTYIFNTKEETEVYTLGSTNFVSLFLNDRNTLELRPKMAKIVSAWQLNSITSPQGNKIVFNYKTETIYTPVFLSESLYDCAGGMTLHPNDPSLYIKKISGIRQHNYSYSYSKITQSVLSDIQFPNGSIVFNTSDRMDLETIDPKSKSQKIDQINIKDKSENFIKSISLNYSYLGNTASYNSCRLLLKSVIEKNAEKENGKYTFVYNEESLPDKNSFETDIWGYYNGPLTYIGNYASRTSRYETLPPTINGGEMKGRLTPGKDTSPSINYMQRGVLNSIEYPTGGKSVFIYEPHEFFNSFETSFTSSSLSQITHDPAMHLNIAELVGNEFTLSEDRYVDIRCLYINRYGYNEQIPQRNIEMVLEKKLSSNLYTFAQQFNGKIDNPAGELSSDLYYLKAGVYRFTLKKELDYQSYPYKPIPSKFFMIITVSDYAPIVISKGGGLRIKTVQNLVENKIVIQKKYKYEKNGLSSGLLILKPDCAHNTLFDKNKFSISDWGKYTLLSQNTFIFGYVTPYISLTGAAGNINYSYVEEYTENVEGKAMGKTSYTFFNTPVSSKIIMPDFPVFYHPNNGAILEVRDYDDKGFLVNKLSKNYSKKSETNLRSAKGLVAHTLPDVARIASKFYDLIPEQWVLDKEAKTQYFNNQKDSVTSVSTYQYHADNRMVSTEQLTDSKNQLIAKRYKYSLDYTDAINVSMKNKNIVGAPIETILLKNNLVVSASKTIFKDTLGIILPRATYLLNTINPLPITSYSTYYDSKFKFELHNIKGKPLQVRAQDNIPVVYLWSYNNQYPIAEIKNATYSQITAIINENTLKSISEKAEPNAVDIQAINGLRTNANLAEALVTTYIYKPLVGVTEITDPRGVTSYYGYDAFGRLIRTYIKEGGVEKTIQSNAYHYQNQ